MSDLETIRSKFESLRPVMDERMCRLWAASEARSLGHGGQTLVATATGLSLPTVLAGGEELERLASGQATEKSRPARRPVCVDQYRVRRPGGGRKLVEVKDPGILTALENRTENDVAGDPMGEAKWVRTTLRGLSERLAEKGHTASTTAGRRLLKQVGCSMKAHKGRPFFVSSRWHNAYDGRTRPIDLRPGCRVEAQEEMSSLARGRPSNRSPPRAAAPARAPPDSLAYTLDRATGCRRPGFPCPGGPSRLGSGFRRPASSRRAGSCCR